MSLSITDNRKSLTSILTSFAHELDLEREGNPQITVPAAVEGFLNREEATESAYDQLLQWGIETERRNKRLLRAIKAVKSKGFYRILMRDVIEDMSEVRDQMVIVREPEGKIQKRTSRLIPAIWVSKWSTSFEGDSFAGYVCVEIKPGRYLKFRFEE